MSALGLARAFAHGVRQAPYSLDGARLMPATVKSGYAASIRRGIAHHVASAALATGPDGSYLAAIWACGGSSVHAIPVLDPAQAVSCRNCAEAARWPHGPVVYRCYAEDGVVIYIGATTNLVNRLRAHKGSTYWYDEVVRVEPESYPTEGAARMAEARAITAEQPFYNRDGNPIRFGLPRTRRQA